MLSNVLGDRAGRIMLLVLTVVTVIAALRYAEAILAPFLFAVVLGVVVSPLAEKLCRAGIPRAVAAAAMLLLTSGVVVMIFALLEPLVTLLVERLPRLQIAVESWIDTLSGILRGIESLSDQIEATVGAETVDKPAEVPSISDALWLAPNLGSQVFIFVGTFFFFVLTRQDIYNSAGELSERLHRADALVSRYFTAVTIVNVGVGVATTLALMVLGLEYAILWGLAAGVLNYILYLGPIIIMVGLLVAGLIQFTGAFAFLPIVAFFTINMIEANFATPLIVGQHVKINPLVVFLAIIFGLWLWGPIGAIVALPVILWLRLMLQPGSQLGKWPQQSVREAV